jgi:hypothetical protein
MSGVVAPAPREHGWTRIVLATAAFLLLARAPGARAVLPVADTYLLLFPILASCFVAGWMAGGPASLAVVWVLMTAALVALPPSGESAAYHDVARAWGLLVAGAFGIVCVLGARGPLFGRSLAAAAGALAGSVIFAGVAALSFPALVRVFVAEFAARNAATEASFARWLPAVSSRFPAAGDWAAQKSIALERASAAVAAPLVPALLVLEALVACALAWALYHRLSRTRLGPPLGSLREFTFGHGLVWALVAGGALLAVPALRQSGAALLGANFVALFGALFALRGAGVAAWFLPLRRQAAQLASWAAALALAPVTVPLALGIGITDDWLDFRGLARAAAAASNSKHSTD